MSTTERSPATAQRRAKLGRPSRAKALKRREELLDQALDLFLARGYELTTIEAIAAATGMSKRTLYAQYEDKAALFRAAVQRAIDAVKVEPAALDALDGGDLAATLAAAARTRIGQVMTPQGLKLQRIVNADSYRFPEVFRMAYDQITGPAVEFVGRVLQRHAAAGDIVLARPELAATAFMSLVASAPIRVLSSGFPLEPAEIEDRIAFTVSLFLDGVRPR